MSSPMKFRTSALFPFVFSTIAFAFVLVLVLSGRNPNSIPDGYLLSFNTTSVGSDLIELNPISPATTTATSVNTARDVRSTNSNASALSVTASNSSLSATTNLNVTSSAMSNSSTTSSAAPTLDIPQATVTNPAAIPIALIGTFFQLMLNTLASGMGQTLETIITTLVVAQKQSMGVDQYYTFHISGICQGTVFNANATNVTLATTPFNLTSCTSYSGVGSYLANLTSNVSDSTLVGATNITVPALSKVPGFGKSAKSLIDLISGVVLAVYVIGLIGNGISILLSIAAFFLPANGNIHTAGAGITTLSTQLLQMAAITSTTIAISISTSINSFSDVLGLSATEGGKFLAFIWVGYIAAQMANGYWITTWFVKFRTTSYKARHRTAQQMQAGYKGIKKEVLSDLRLGPKGEEWDVEVSRSEKVDIQHWQDIYPTSR